MFICVHWQIKHYSRHGISFGATKVQTEFENLREMGEQEKIRPTTILFRGSNKDHDVLYKFVSRCVCVWECMCALTWAVYSIFATI